MNDSVTVILSTYNGEKYIKELLNSLLNQTRAPDEVLISDDDSTDDVCQIIKNFINKSGLDNWKLSRNLNNIGWKANFRNLATQASGDLIFFCDQDDIWNVNKIELMTKVMCENLNINALSCAVDILYEEGSRKINFGRSETKSQLESYKIRDMEWDFMFTFRPGCTYCVRKDFIESLLPFWNLDFAHDQVVWTFATATGTMALMSERLVTFRRHSNNASEIEGYSRDSRLRQVENSLKLNHRIVEYLESLDSISYDKNLQFLRLNSRWLKSRIAFIEGVKRVSNLSTLISLYRFYPTLKSFLGDICCSISSRKWIR